MILMTATILVGSASIWLLGKAVKRKLLYFKFLYPWQTLILLGISLLGICVIFSCVTYLKNRNLADELRRKND